MALICDLPRYWLLCLLSYTALLILHLSFSLPMFATQIFQHVINQWFIMVPVCNESCCSSLHHFYFILVLLQIWIPDWASILHRWSYKGDVSPFFKDLCKPVSVLYWKLTQSLSKSYPGVAGVCLHTTCRFLLHVVALNCSFEAFYSFAAHSTFC